MARIRSVKPELRTSEVVASWPREVRYAFVLLWMYLDDSGRGLDVPKAIAGDLFPHDEDISPAKMGRWLTTMASSRPEKRVAPLCRYEVNGRKYLHCVNWGEHQRPNRPSPSRLPPCPTHDRSTEPLTEPLTDPLHEPSLSGSLHGAAEVDSRGAEEQQRPGGEPPPGDRQLDAGAMIIAKTTDATPDEARAIAELIVREKRPRNVAGFINSLSRGPDLVGMLDDYRTRAGKNGVAEAIAAARRGKACEHGEQGGAFLHPISQQPLCPLCRISESSRS